jgi:hypothetical protein
MDCAAPNCAPTSGSVTLLIDVSLPTIDWYDVKGQLEDGARLGVFADDVLVDTILVTPGDKETVRAVSVPSTASKLTILRLSEDIYSNESKNAPVIASVRLSEDIHSTVTKNAPVIASGRNLTPLPALPTYHIVGDSDTAGFGIHSHPYDPKCLNPYNLWSEIGDASLSWAAQLSHLAKVEPVITAISGVGIDKAYGNQPWKTYRDRSNPFDGANIWDYKSQQVPELVLVLLGPNDCGNSNANSCPEDFQQNYVELLDHYSHAYQEEVTVVSVIGGSSSGLNDALVDAVTNATATYNAGGAGDGGAKARAKPAMQVILTREVWEEINDHSNGFNGCFGHYNEKGHALVAKDLYAQLTELGL